jgi:AcrR family transcriptional regulator
LRNALLATASRLVAERGAEAVSLRAISQAAGVSHAAAYRHYADKQAVWADLAEAGFRELAEINRRTIESTSTGPVEQLKACGRAYVEFSVRQPHPLQLMFGGVIVDWASHPSLAQASAALADSLAGVVRAGQDAGELRTGSLQDLTLTAWSLVHGLALLIVGRRIPNAKLDATFLRHSSQACVTLLIEGLRRPDGARRTR